MRVSRYTAWATMASALLMTPAPAPAAASKEMQDLQRDVAQLQDQLTQLQKSSDAKFAALQAQLQQALDVANKTNSGVSSMNAGVTQTIQSELRAVREQLSGVTGLSVKVDSTSNDVSDLKSALQALLVTVNRQQSTLNDILNQVKLIQAPPAAPPAADAVPGGAPPPPSAQALFTSGVNDMNAGKGELALSEFAEFLHLYPNDGNANSVQYNIGEIHYGQPGKLEQAVADFDAVIEQYSKDQQITPRAYFMKGMALKKLNRSKDAIAAFRAVVADFPRSDESVKAKAQLNSMGATTPAGRKK
jgi:TolA-binding protein